jgi:hypothetical protein
MLSTVLAPFLMVPLSAGSLDVGPAPLGLENAVADAETGPHAISGTRLAVWQHSG